MIRREILNYNMLNINLQTILFFLEVADQGNMTIAANNLHVTQPFLSQRISSVETALNLKLFERKYHSMKLTEEGEILYNEWSRIIEIYQNSVDEARALEENKKKRISIGLWDNINFTVQGKIANKLTTVGENRQLSMRLYNLINTQSELLNGYSDLIIAADYEDMSGNPEIITKEITRLDLYANINKKNPLSSKTDLTLEDLKDEKWLCTKTSKPFSYQLFMTYQCEKMGFRPQFLLTEDTAQQNFKLLFNEAISICPLISMDPYTEDIESCRISGNQVPVVYAWRRDAKTEIEEFADESAPLLKEVFDSYNRPEAIVKDTVV